MRFLESIQSNTLNCYDWKITISYYVAVHLVNAHISKFDKHYRTHKEVDQFITFANPMSVGRILQEPYTRYIFLSQLSRRARYMIHEDVEKTDSSLAYSTHDKHFARAIRHLDFLLIYFSEKYPNEYSAFKDLKIKIQCSELKAQENLRFFSLVK